MCNLYTQTKSQDAMRHVFDDVLKNDESFEDLAGMRIDAGVTNIRNMASPHWRRWLGASIAALHPSPAFSRLTNAPAHRATIRFGLRSEQPWHIDVIGGGYIINPLAL